MDRSSDAPFVYQRPKIKEGGIPFWVEQPSILFRRDRLTNFFPTAKLTVVENLNAVIRLLIYLSLILILFTRNSQYLLLPLGGMLVTYVLFQIYPKKEVLKEIPPRESFSLDGKLSDKIQSNKKYDEQLERECIQPTVDNPFMNFNYITDSYHREPACQAWLYDDKESKDIRKEVTESFNHDLYRDVSDLYSKNNSQRQFFTMPWTSWPNNQTSFAKWLYRTGPTCKELGSKCAPYWNPTASYSLLEN